MEDGTSANIVAMNYADFRKAFKWKQGEHVALIGPTGMGKTTLGLDLLELREYVTVIGTKPKDDTLAKFAKKKRYTVVPTFPSQFDEDHPRLILWPRMKRFKDMGKQRQAIGHGLQTIFTQGSWAVFADEVSYISNDLKLEPFLKLIWQQGRSLGISLMAGTQRPAWVPVLIYDQSTHLFFWRDNDETNLRRIGGIGHLNAAEIRDTVARLPKYVFLYVNSRTGKMIVSKAPAP